MQDDEFEWDDAKAVRNHAKHGITFEMARDAFDDLLSFGWDDDGVRYGEGRYCLLGMVDNRLLFVVHTMREDRIRIISARGATPHERRQYYQENRRR